MDNGKKIMAMLTLYWDYAKKVGIYIGTYSLPKFLISFFITIFSFDFKFNPQFTIFCFLGVPQSIFLIPQASIVTKLVPGDKYLKYHSQSKKETAELLFEAFEHYLKEVCAEALAKNVTLDKKNKPQKNNPEKLRNAEVLPKDVFKEGLGGEEFLAFDDATGFPTLDKDGNEITKTKRKKLEKMLQKYEEKWNKKKTKLSESNISKEAADEKQNFQKDLDGDIKEMSLKDAKDCDKSTDLSTDQTMKTKSLNISELELADEIFVFPQFVKGTFGGRQGLEFVSSGPFTHSFSFE